MHAAWTVETLKEYLEGRLADLKVHMDQRFKDQKEAVLAALVSSEKAVDKAEINSEKWRANANEWRAAMSDRETRFATRSEVLSDLKALEAKVSALKESRDLGLGGRGALDSGRAWIIAAVTIAGFLLMVGWRLMGR